MTTVREAAFDLFRARGMTTIFGNPGSTELPMLADFPDGFRYVLGLQEAVVVGMADGFAQASGRVAHGNLHTAPGVGNAMGAIFNAQANKAPLLITAGQQVRAHITMQANLTNRDATRVPHPYVKWSFEPPRAQDVPAALARAVHLASLPPAGPAFVSLPMDDWDAEVDDADVGRLVARRVTGRAAAAPDAVGELARRLLAARAPALVAGPDVDASGAWGEAVALAERLRMTVWATPAPGGGRLGFPEDHPLFRGILPPALGPAGQALEGHDLVLVAGSSVFPYYPYLPGPALPEGCELVALTNDPDEAARAPMGDAIVADVALTLGALLAELGESERPATSPPLRPPVPPGGPLPAPSFAPPPGAPPPFPPAASPPASGDGPAIDPGDVHGTLAEVLPEDAILVLESPSSTLAARSRLRLSRPGSYFFSASGGLGFGLSAAIGVQLAQPDRPVVCVLGEGSAQYAITGLWTAAAYRVPVTFVVLNNGEYAILKWFSQMEGVTGAPGLDLPALRVAATAASYGVRAREVGDRDELREEVADALADDSAPRLVEVGVTPGMALA
jgi:benzoylformate decarboxylase